MPKPQNGGIGKFSLSAMAMNARTDKVDTDALKIPLKAIAPNPDQPRSNSNPESLQELVDSIRQHGVLQSILVRQEDEGYILIAGDRRWRAAQEAGLTEIPARVVDCNREQARYMAVIENLQRENLTKEDEQRFFQTLINQYNMGLKDIAAIINKSMSYVSRVLSGEYAITKDIEITQVEVEVIPPDIGGLSKERLEEIKQKYPDWYGDPRYLVRIKPTTFNGLLTKLEQSLKQGFEIETPDQPLVRQKIARLKELFDEFEAMCDKTSGEVR